MKMLLFLYLNMQGYNLQKLFLVFIFIEVDWPQIRVQQWSRTISINNKKNIMYYF